MTMQAVIKLFGTLGSSITTQNPKANGQVERFNRSLKSYLKNYVADDTLDWEPYIRPLQIASNSAVNKSTLVTPYEAVFGRHPTLPWSLIKPRPTQPQGFAGKHYERLLEMRDLVVGNNDEARQAYTTMYNRKARQ